MRKLPSNRMSGKIYKHRERTLSMDAKDNNIDIIIAQYISTV